MKSLHIHLFTLLLAIGLPYAASGQTDFSVTEQFIETSSGGVYIPALEVTAFMEDTDIFFVNADGTIDEGGLTLYGDGLPVGWQAVTGAARWDENNVMLFNDNEYALFDTDEATITYRGSFPGIATQINAVTTWGESQLLFFTGSTYVIYDKDDASVSEEMDIDGFDGYELDAPDAVVNAEDGYLYFFSRGSYQALDMETQSFGDVITVVAASSSGPPVATRSGGLPPVSKTGFSRKRNGPPVASKDEESIPSTKKAISSRNKSSKKTNEDKCLLGVPKKDSDSDLMSDETRMGGRVLGDVTEDDLDDDKELELVEIRVWGGSVVAAIQTVVKDEYGELEELPILGTKRGRMQSFFIPEGDCLKAVQGQFGGDYGMAIHNLTFITSSTKSKRMGSSGNVNFNLKLDKRVGFYGFKVSNTKNITSIGMKYVGYEDDMPDETETVVASNVKSRAFKDLFKGEYDDQHVDYLKEELIELQGGGSEFSRLELPAKDWMGKAVDYLTLDPLDIAKSPTKKTAIRLVASEERGGVRSDKVLPHGTHFTTISGGMQRDEKSWVENYSDLTKDFNVGVDVSVGTPVGGGSMSASYRQMNNTKIGREEIYYSRTAERKIFNLKMDLLFSDPETGDLKRQLLDYDFRRMVDTLPVPSSVPRIKLASYKKGKKLPSQLERVRKSYMKVIEKYGTHFVEEADFGGKFTSYTVITKEDYENTRMTQTEFKASAEAQIKAVNIGGGVEFGYGTKSIVGNKKGKLDSRNFVQGGNGEIFETWNTSVSQNPVPTRVKLRPLSDLLTTEYWPQHPDIKKRQSTLLAVINQYLVDNDRAPSGKRGKFFTDPKAVDYTYTMSITGIKCTAVNDAKLDGAANVYGSIYAGYTGDVGYKNEEVWRMAKSSSVDVRKGGMEPITEKITVVASGDQDGTFTIQGSFDDALSNGMAGFGKLITDGLKSATGKHTSYGSYSLSIPFSDIPETPKEFKVTGFDYQDTKLEIAVTVSKRPDYMKEEKKETTTTEKSE